MNSAIRRRIEKLELGCPAVNGLEAAHAYARTALEIKTGHTIPDGPLLDRLALWGARYGVSVKGHLDAMARVDRMASYLGGCGMAEVKAGNCIDLAGKTSDDLLALLDIGEVDESDLLNLYGVYPKEFGE